MYVNFIYKYCIVRKTVVESRAPICCQALTASCEACKAGVTVEEYCRRNPLMNGCPKGSIFWFFQNQSLLRREIIFNEMFKMSISSNIILQEILLKSREHRFVVKLLLLRVKHARQEFLWKNTVGSIRL